MKIKEFDIILNIKEPTNQEEFEVVQGDSGSNLLRVTLIDGLEQYDLTGTNVEIVFRKADGTTVQQTDTSIISRTGGRFQVILKTNTIACPGPVTAEVRILEEEILLTSTRFGFFVRKSLVDDDTIESTNEFPILTQLVNDTKEIIESIPTIEYKLGEITNTESNLNQSITEGNALKADLDITIGEGNVLKTGLDNSIEDGNVLKGDLDEIIAGTDYEHLLTELNDKLDKTGDTKDNTVTFEQAAEDGELTSGSKLSALFGLIKKKFADILTSLAGKIDKTSIAQTTEVNDSTKVPSTAVTHGMQQNIVKNANDIGVLTNNLPNYVTYQNGFTDLSVNDRSYFFKIGKIVTVVVSTKGDISTSSPTVFSLPSGYRPISNAKVNYIRDGFTNSGTLTVDITGNVKVHNITAYNGSACGILTFLTA